MVKLDYGIKDFDKTAWSAIDRRETVQLIVRGRKREVVKRALLHYREYFDAKRRGQASRVEWIKFGWYGIRMPTFWSVYNHAEMAGMQVATEGKDDCLLVTFAPATAVPTGTSMH